MYTSQKTIHVHRFNTVKYLKYCRTLVFFPGSKAVYHLGTWPSVCCLRLFEIYRLRDPNSKSAQGCNSLVRLRLSVHPQWAVTLTSIQEKWWWRWKSWCDHQLPPSSPISKAFLCVSHWILFPPDFEMAQTWSSHFPQRPHDKTIEYLSKKCITVHTKM